MPLAESFAKAFIAAYNDAKGFISDSDWGEIWKSRWNNFILWNPPAPLNRTVLGMTADRMGLIYWDREPFRVDAAFVRQDYRLIGNLPVPIVIAIEHENDFRTFEQEIAKLFHIRCPLKVGISYSLMNLPAKEQEIEKVMFQMTNWLREINGRMVIEEAMNTEYLYLIGVEKAGLTLEWYSYNYTASVGPEKGLWKKVGG